MSKTYPGQFYTDLSSNSMKTHVQLLIVATSNIKTNPFFSKIPNGNS